MRDEAIVVAFNSGGFSVKELGEYFGLRDSRVSRILKKNMAGSEGGGHGAGPVLSARKSNVFFPILEKERVTN